MTIKTFKDLIAWQKAFELVPKIYLTTKSFPTEERYGLSSQMRRAAVSVASNIAEGYARSSLQQYIHFLYISFGSCAELQTQIMLAGKLDYFDSDICSALLEQCNEIDRILLGLIRSLEKHKTENY